MQLSSKMSALDFSEFFRQVYGVVTRNFIRSHVFRCECPGKIQESVNKFERLVCELQDLPMLDELESDFRQEIVDRTRGQLVDFVDDNQCNISNSCRVSKSITTKETLNLHLLCTIITLMSIEHLWGDVLQQTRPLFPSKSNKKLAKEMRRGLMMFCNMTPEVNYIARKHPQHFLFITLTQFSDEGPCELEDLCKRAFKFLRKVGGTGITKSDKRVMFEYLIETMNSEIRGCSPDGFSATYDSEDTDSDSSDITQ